MGVENDLGGLSLVLVPLVSVGVGIAIRERRAYAGEGRAGDDEIRERGRHASSSWWVERTVWGVELMMMCGSMPAESDG